MAFRITSIDSPQFTGEVTARRSSNWVTIVTGINGTGKSRLLVSMLNYFDKRLSYKMIGRPTFSYRGTPNKIVAQTFSPFSRFPPARGTRIINQTATPLGILLRNRYVSEKYIPIGFYRSAGIYSNNIVKKVIEDALVKVCCEKEGSYPAAVNVFSQLGYQGKIEIEFRPANGLGLDGDIFLKPMAEIKKYVSHVLADINSGRSVNTGSVRVLEREMKVSGIDNLTIELSKAIHNLGINLRSENFDVEFDDLFRLEIGFSDLSDSNRKLLRSALILRRSGFLNITDFYVYPMKKERPTKGFPFRNHENRIEIDELSSGQLQIIGTVFSLAIMVEDNSLILIDEPELSLHPKWQMEWLGLILSSTKKYKGCHIVVATHSALITADALSRDIQVISLDSTVDIPDVSKSASVEETLTQVFSTPVKHSAYLSNLLFEAVGLANAPEEERYLMLRRLEDLAEIYKKDVIVSALISDAVSLLNE